MPDQTTGGSAALPAQIAGLARDLLGILGTALVAKHVITNSDVDTFIGVGMVVAGVLWGLWQKHESAKVITQAQTSRAPAVEAPRVPL